MWLEKNCQFVQQYVSKTYSILNFLPKMSRSTHFSQVQWICQNWYMDFHKLLHGFVKNGTWISVSCYMNLSRLMHGFFKVITWICQSCSMWFSAKQNQAEVWPRFQSLLKLLALTKGVEWVKVLNALGPLCLWQCFCDGFLFIKSTQCVYVYFRVFHTLIIVKRQWIVEL